MRKHHTEKEYLVDDKPFQVLNLISIGMQCRSRNGLIPLLYFSLSHRHRKMDSHARLHHFVVLDLQQTAEHIYFIHIVRQYFPKRMKKRREWSLQYIPFSNDAYGSVCTQVKPPDLSTQ